MGTGALGRRAWAVARVLARYIPGAAGPIRERDVCLYTNTLAADARSGPTAKFILGRLPGDPRVIVASPCSGHGFTFASAFGPLLARMAVDPAFEADPAFGLARFSSFVSGGP